MGLWTLVGVLAFAWAFRIAFLAIHFADLDGLWYDFERRLGRFQLARLLDYATLFGFLGCAAFALWPQNAADPQPLGKFFVAWLGWSLLERLPIHRLPRTNRPGAYAAAKIALAANVILALLSAAAFTGFVALYYWWRG